MTEVEWLTSDDPDQLLLWNHPRFTPRKLRLFAVACCRVVQWRFTDPRSWAAVEAVEAYLDGALPLESLRTRAIGASEAWTDVALHRDRRPMRNTKGGELTTLAAWQLISPFVAEDPIPGDLRSSVNATIGIARQGVKRAKGVQAELFRDVFARPDAVMAFDPAWRTSDVLLLARGIYEEWAFDRMPILADALQDAGCDSDDILSHLRDANATHVRGCWALDLVLEKT
jgi:hypothetical protein